MAIVDDEDEPVQAAGGGKWAWSWMLPQPDTICQLPYSVEREELDRLCSAVNLPDETPKGNKDETTAQKRQVGVDDIAGPPTHEPPSRDSQRAAASTWESMF